MEIISVSGFLISSSLLFMDYGQTRTIALSNEKFLETNPILGPAPNLENINVYFGEIFLIHSILNIVLPNKYKTIWNFLVIGTEAAYVGGNYSLGIHMSF